MIGVLTMPIEQTGAVLAVSAVSLVLPFMMMVMSFCAIIWPRAMWWLSDGWKFKGVEPSGCALVATRVGGLIGLIVGTALLIILNAQPVGG
jgi:hypothetical protein